MFDTMKVARKMKEARIALNLTQMNLADEMEVSYQAVSNWERGNSMPDISKLEQLCQILQIGIDELLGADTAKGLTKLMHQDQNAEIVTVEEIKEFAPMLHPEYVKKVVDQNLGREEESPEGKKKISPQTMIALAPFLSQEDLDSLVKHLEGEVELGELVGLAPFLEAEMFNELFLRRKDEIELGELVGLAPFLNQELLNEQVLRTREEFGFEELGMLAPFLDSKVLKVLVMKLRE